MSVEPSSGDDNQLRYRANEPRIVHETLDGQSLIMDMAVGTYFSCDGVSSTAWIALTEGATPAELAEWLSREYGAEPAGVEHDVRQFVASLVAESMVVERSEPALAGDPFASPRAPGPYQGLVVERFTDLADLILLDPVHDVTDAGWPHTPE